MMRAAAATAARPGAAGARRRFAVGHLALIAGSIAAALLAFAWVAWAPDLIRDRVVAAFEARTGRALAIDGPVSLTLWPPGVTLERISVRAPEPAPGPLLTADRIRVAVTLSGLLAGTTSAEQITLERPRLMLRVGPDGRRSWERAETPATQRILSADSPRSTRTDAGSPATGRRAPRHPLGHVTLVDGEIEFADVRIGRRIAFTAVQGTLRQPDLASPVAIDGRIAWNDEVLRLTGTAERLARSPSDPVPVDVTIESPRGRAHYRGMVAGDDGLALDGRIAIATGRLSDAVQWLTGAGVLSDDRPMEAEARIVTGRTRTAFTELEIRSPAVSGKGAIAIERTSARPLLTGELRLARLDLDALVGGHGSAPRQQSIGPTSHPPAGDGQPGPRDIDNDPGSPETKGAAESGGAGGGRRGRQRGVRPWYETAIPFAALGLLDADTELVIDRLQWRGGEIGAMTARMAILSGGLQLDIASAALFGGEARGTITSDAAGRVAIDATIRDAAALELFRSTARFEVLEGPATVRIKVSGAGRSEREIVSTLAGTARVEIAGGALRGWSVSDALEEARRLQIPDLKRNPAAATPFDRLEAAVTIKDGIATFESARIAATPLSLDGAGTIDIAGQSLQMTLTPRVAAEGSRLAGLTLPLKLQGAWSDPRLSADVRRILRSPGKALGAAREAAKEAARAVKEEDIDKAARRLLGEGEASKKGAERAKRLLRRFLKE